jgi:hypothetical protein
MAEHRDDRLAGQRHYVDRVLNRVARPVPDGYIELPAEQFPVEDPGHIEMMRASFQWNVPEDTRIELLQRLIAED